MSSSKFKEGDEEPGFTDPFRAHREHMQRFIRSFSEPLGVPVVSSLRDGRSQDMAQSSSSRHALSNNHLELMRNPFGIVDNMISNMRNTSWDSENGNVNGHSFSSSSVMTYTKVGNEPPKVFQACSSTRRAPGGVKETRQAVKDSVSGLEKLSIGHHIQDRAHIMEKKYNNKTGAKEFNQEFQNLEDSEAEAFDKEWKQKVSTFKCDFMSLEPRASTCREHPRLATKREPGSKRQ
ncbi:unnamed protein product [Knipowitschia caucasica]|uniref:Myeloid leukemia factor 1 n=2 Tax=Knipowitschia caucasica TaxID=637954 RepID=A0AAV2J5M8_KNICA